MGRTARRGNQGKGRDGVNFDFDWADARPGIFNALIVGFEAALVITFMKYFTNRYNLPTKDFWAGV